MPRFVSRGRAYVYLLPCGARDIQKIGFSRDPLRRFWDLHRRFFEFFDLERGMLIAADRVRAARLLERLLMKRFAAQSAQAPLEVRAVAAGQTEWYCGIHDDAELVMRDVARDEGLAMHIPLRNWLRERARSGAEQIYDWSQGLLELMAYQRFNLPECERHPRAAVALRDTLDLYRALRIDIQSLVTEDVWAWYMG